MDSEAEKKLYNACLKGDVRMLEALIREDELTLARVSISSYFNQTPLHLASMLGHSEFAEFLLSHKPDFANRFDSQGRSALHLASANGYANIVKLLLAQNETMCSVPDVDERTPLHLAVMNGQYDCVEEFIKANSKSNDQGLDAVLHMCVMCNRLDVLILVLGKNPIDLSDVKDEDGNTILHYAAGLRRIQIVKYLVTTRSEAEVNVKNNKGHTALDTIEEMLKDVKAMEIKQLLVSVSTKKTQEAPAGPGIFNKLLHSAKKIKKFAIFQDKMETKDETLLVAASVIAAMAYTSAISPPGGVASMDAASYSVSDPWYFSYFLAPGSSLLAYFFAPLSNTFWVFNTISFIAALSVIFIYVTGASLKQKLIVWSIRGAMWITLSAMIFAYEAAVRATTPKYHQNNRTLYTIRVGLYSWLALMVIAVLVVVFHVCRYIVKTISTILSDRNKKMDASTFRNSMQKSISRKDYDKL
ncbi:hypothetical protein DCAR_0314244 [Daucus carota subsp. sativus]|uniref:PGG domain-containing protein n=1 Tax=Daucus carota subsp. sativus TaxID=79200 RepID=A0AAF0WSI0_DAUCS|nr:PREDICTED: ankyrin repeat-containing protein At3g12360-like [Daucus carota subsp. sativus]WOG94947.1 hypothetical protein DCAR_0314244 [Daucus carota subsp. sativus]